jgi:AraC-like DNA-binding protein
LPFILLVHVLTSVDGHEPVILQTDDFALIPAASDFAMTSLEPPSPKDTDKPPVMLADGSFRVGVQEGPPDALVLVGHCVASSPDAALLGSLLPQPIHVRGDRRLATLARLVRDETHAQRPARDVVLARPLEVLFIEVLFIKALRSSGTAASPGLVRGLADPRLAAAIRQMHERPTETWTVAQLAKEAALSRSAFFERFSRAVGVAPMEYRLSWRMALAKNLLLREECSVTEVAGRVGYSPASTFSVAFTRHVGLPPTRYARDRRLVSPQL